MNARTAAFLSSLLAVAAACTPEPWCARSASTDEIVSARSQVELERLAGCESVRGLDVSPPDDPANQAERVVDLAPLSSLRTVETFLMLRLPGIASLEALAGVETLGTGDDPEFSGVFELRDSDVSDLHGLEALGSSADSTVNVLRLIDNARLESLELLPDYSALVGLELRGNDAIASLAGLEPLRSVEVLTLDGASLASLSALSADLDVGMFTLGPAAFADLQDFAALPSVEILHLGSPALRDVDLSQAASLEGLSLTASGTTHLALPPPASAPLTLSLNAAALASIDGLDAYEQLENLTVDHCSALTSLPVEALARVDRNVRIVFNEQLEQAALEERFASVVVGRDRKIAGNNGWVIPASGCPFEGDGECDAETLCAAGTDIGDCTDSGD